MRKRERIQHRHCLPPTPRVVSWFSLMGSFGWYKFHWHKMRSSRFPLLPGQTRWLWKHKANTLALEWRLHIKSFFVLRQWGIFLRSWAQLVETSALVDAHLDQYIDYLNITHMRYCGSLETPTKVDLIFLTFISLNKDRPPHHKNCNSNFFHLCDQGVI